MNDFEKSLRQTIEMCDIVLDSDRSDMKPLRERALKIKQETEENLKQYIAAQESTI